jgi:hypothetical protein
MVSLIRPWNIFSGIFGPGTPPASFVQRSNDPVPAVNTGPDLTGNVRYEDRLTAEKRFYSCNSHLLGTRTGSSEAPRIGPRRSHGNVQEIS